MTRKRPRLVAFDGIRRVVLYLRVSTKKQATEGQSLDAQDRALRKFCFENGWEVVAVFREEGVSARDDGRPQFKQMIEFVINACNGIEAIVVLMSSRFYRNSLKSRNEKQVLAGHGVRVVPMLNKVEDTPGGKLAERVYEAFDEYESDVIGIRTRLGMAENARKGYLNGSQAPYGFVAAPIKDGAKMRRKAVVAPEEAEVVRDIFKLYSELTGAKGVAMELTRRGLRYRSAPWDKDKILATLKNSAAIGCLEWGRFDTKTGEERPEIERQVIECERIIDQPLWETVQRLLAERDPSKTPGQVTASPMLLAGLVRCGRCGKSYGIETGQKTMADQTKVTHRYYNCRQFVRCGKEVCEGFRIPEQTFDDAVIAFLSERLFTTERCREILHEVMSETGGIQEKTTEKRKQLEASRREVERLIQRWEAAFEADTDLQEHGGPGRYKELLQKKRDLDRAIVELRELRRPPVDLARPEVIQRFQKLLKEALRGPDRQVSKRYLRMLVARIVVHPSSTGAREVNIEVIAKGTGVVTAMATTPSLVPSMLTAERAVHASVGEWLQLKDSNLGPGG